MFCCSSKITKGNDIRYDTEIGWNTINTIKTYRDIYRKNNSKDSNGINDWMYWAEFNNHHRV